MTKSGKNYLSNTLIYLSYIAIVIFFLFPIFWVISLSLKNIPELFASPPIIFPAHPHFDNYLHVIKNTNIFGYLKNSVIIVGCTLIFVMLFAIPASYAFSRMEFKFKNLSLITILICQMISPVVIAIPLYQFFGNIGLLNNFFSLIAIYVAIESPIATWFLKGYFDSIPKDLDEAATIDGCSRMGYILRVLLPIARPGMISVAILTGVQSWSQFVIPFILLDNNKMYPISVGLVSLKSTSNTITTHYLAAASVIGILPVIIMFIILQKYIVGALTKGAVKG